MTAIKLSTIKNYDEVMPQYIYDCEYSPSYRSAVVRCVDQTASALLVVDEEELAEQMYLADYPTPPNEYVPFSIIRGAGKEIYLRNAKSIAENAGMFLRLEK